MSGSTVRRSSTLNISSRVVIRASSAHAILTFITRDTIEKKQPLCLKQIYIKSEIVSSFNSLPSGSNAVLATKTQ